METFDQRVDVSGGDCFSSGVFAEDAGSLYFVFRDFVPEEQVLCPLSQWATGQVASRFGLQPYVLQQHLDAKFAAELLNSLSQKIKSREFFLRVLDGTVRAFLSTRYVVVDDRDILDAAMSWCSRSDWSLGEAETTMLRERLMAVLRRPVGSDDEQILLESIGADCFGIVLLNSEVGAAYPAAQPALIFPDCAIPVASLSPRIRLRGGDAQRSVEKMVTEAAWRLDALERAARASTARSVTSRDVNQVVRREKLYDVESEVMTAAHEQQHASAVDVAKAIAQRADRLGLPQRIRVMQAAGAVLFPRGR